MAITATREQYQRFRADLAATILRPGHRSRREEIWQITITHPADMPRERVQEHLRKVMADNMYWCAEPQEHDVQYEAPGRTDILLPVCGTFMDLVRAHGRKEVVGGDPEIRIVADYEDF